MHVNAAGDTLEGAGSHRYPIRKHSVKLGAIAWQYSAVDHFRHIMQLALERFNQCRGLQEADFWKE